MQYGRAWERPPIFLVSPQLWTVGDSGTDTALGSGNVNFLLEFVTPVVHCAFHVSVLGWCLQYWGSWSLTQSLILQIAWNGAFLTKLPHRASIWFLKVTGLNGDAHRESVDGSQAGTWTCQQWWWHCKLQAFFLVHVVVADVQVRKLWLERWRNLSTFRLKMNRRGVRIQTLAFLLSSPYLTFSWMRTVTLTSMGYHEAPSEHLKRYTWSLGWENTEKLCIFSLA